MRVQLPKIPAGLKEATNDPKVLKPNAHIDRKIIRGFEALTIAAQKMKLDEVALDRLVLVNGAFDEITMLDAEVRSCDLSAAVCTGGAFNRVRFTNCRMAGLDLSRCKLQQVTFSDCRLDMANFRFAKLDGVRFENCTLIESDFQVGELSDVTFEGCTIESVIFDQCKVRNVDARSSELYNIHGWRYLRNLTIDHAQLIAVAPELARELGIDLQ